MKKPVRFSLSYYYFVHCFSARSPGPPAAFKATPHVSERTARERAITHQDVKSNQQSSSPAIDQVSSHCACPTYTPPQAFSHSRARHWKWRGFWFHWYGPNCQFTIRPFTIYKGGNHDWWAIDGLWDCKYQFLPHGIYPDDSPYLGSAISADWRTRPQ